MQILGPNITEITHSVHCAHSNSAFTGIGMAHYFNQFSTPNCLRLAYIVEKVKNKQDKNKTRSNLNKVLLLEHQKSMKLSAWKLENKPKHIVHCKT